MHEDIEKLLVLQERDRSIAHAEQEISGLEHERVEVNSRSADAEAGHEAAQLKAKELEARKNALEGEVQAEQEKIRTYARQQMDTKDNVQYKALGRQQETCKETISDFLIRGVSQDILMASSIVTPSMVLIWGGSC